MKRFRDFAKEPTVLDGEKLKIENVLNMEINIIGYKVKNSKYPKNNNGKCLTLQFQIGDKRHVLFTGSDVLMDQIEKYKDEIPFMTTIKKIDRYYTFS